MDLLGSFLFLDRVWMSPNMDGLPRSLLIVDSIEIWTTRCGSDLGFGFSFQISFAHGAIPIERVWMGGPDDLCPWAASDCLIQMPDWSGWHLDRLSLDPAFTGRV